MTYISWFSDFALYLEYYLLDKCHTWDISSLWPDYWRQNISLLVWPIFHGSVILPYILNIICWINVTPGILLPCDPIIDVKIYLFWCDLYFMVHDFALYLEYFLLDKCHTWDISSMWPNEWPLTISRSLWPIFHGSAGIILAPDFCERKNFFGQKQWEIFKFSEIFFSLARTNWVRFFFFFFL